MASIQLTAQVKIKNIPLISILIPPNDDQRTMFDYVLPLGDWGMTEKDTCITDNER